MKRFEVGPRISAICGILVLACSTLALLAWWALGPLLGGLQQSEILRVLPLEAFAFALAAIGLLSCVVETGKLARVLAVAAALCPAMVLVESVLGLSGGIENLFVPESSPLTRLDAVSWRPGPQTSVSLLLYGAALWFAGGTRGAHVDTADILALASLFLPGIALLGHLFQADVLYQGGSQLGAGMSLAVAILFGLLGVGVVTLKAEGGLLANVLAPTAGGQVSRRLVPAAVVVPILLGLLQLHAVGQRLMDLSMALAIAVGISILVYLILIHWVSVLLARLEVQQAGENTRRVTLAQEEGMTDALTGLLNRRGWEHNLAKNEERCRREGINACVVVIDMDGLKQVNDTQGHTEGDALIRRCAQALRGAARRDDVLARLGGDEFAYLAIGCEPQHAHIVVRRLSQAMTNASVQASIGYAMRDLNASLKGAFDEADQAMYADKRQRKAKKAAASAA
ncbi:MAG: GGDEF domain-containing protein [Gammaproteobacteria bacterium]|nr:GGDEF domain-containing protein [Gammaproteobacteria bacterium]